MQWEYYSITSLFEVMRRKMNSDNRAVVLKLFIISRFVSASENVVNIQSNFVFNGL